MEFELEPVVDFDAFSNRINPRVQMAEETGNYSMPAMAGTIISEPVEGRVKVRSLSGEILVNVKLPGGSIGDDGFLHGSLGGSQIGALVLVGFSHGNIYSPMITEFYPQAGEEKKSKNFAQFLTNEIDFDEKNDIIHGHKSGYKVIFKDNKIQILNKLFNNVVEIDTIEQTVKIKDGEIPAVNTTLLEEWMVKINEVLDNLYTAIQNSTTVPSDGGSSFKAGLVQAIQTKPIPEIPTKLKDTNLSYSEKLI